MAIKSKKISPVLTFMQLFAHVAHFEVFLDVCFGNMHPTVTELNYLRSYLQDEQFRMERTMVADRFLGSQIVTMVRLQITGFLRSASSTAGRVFMPDLQSMTNALRFGTWRPPNLPRSITSLLYLPPVQSPGTLVTQPQAVVSQQRPPPTFYTDPAQTSQQNNPPTRSRGEQIRNYAFNTAWLYRPALKPVITQARTVPGGDVPKTDDNTEFCMSFQFKGECRSNCAGRATH